jgi:hypothetical protein
MNSREFSLLAVILLSVLFVCGCGPRQNIEEMKSALVDFDPSFKEVLDKKADIDAQIETLKGEFRTKQGEVNSKIMELEEELKAARKELYSKTKELSLRLEPDRQRVNLKIEEIKMKLAGKEARAGSIKSSIKNQNGLLGNKKLNLSDQEQAELRGSIEKSMQELTPLEEEIAVLRREVQLYRQESSLLKY